ncbi:MAG: hypothetical protein ACXV8O_09340 [Methylobacter sp.]
MEKCWANILQGCDGKISREHIVSESLFISTEVDVRGFSWCKDETKRIGLANLTKKCLCEKHNRHLSPIDSAAGHAFSVLREQTKLSNDRVENPNKKFKKIEFSINATALERWLLKTLINFSYDSEYYIGHESQQKGRPSEHLVNISFGIEKFKKNNGMYVVYKEGTNLKFQDTVEFLPLIKDNKFICGGMFTFRGVLLFLDISSDGVKTPFKEIPGINPEWHNVQLSKKFKKIKAITSDKKISHIVNFNWV